MNNARWSSPVARQAHNLKVVSSNLTLATKNWNVAQLVEQRIENPRVLGSTPSFPAILKIVFHALRHGPQFLNFKSVRSSTLTVNQ
jgi:hypothetical protein